MPRRRRIYTVPADWTPEEISAALPPGGRVLSYHPATALGAPTCVLVENPGFDAVPDGRSLPIRSLVPEPAAAR